MVGKNWECGIVMIDRKSLCQSSNLFVIRTASQEGERNKCNKNEESRQGLIQSQRK